MNIVDMRRKLGMSQSQFASKFNIPVKTVQKWEQGLSTPPVYVPELIQRVIELEDKLKLEDLK